MKKCPFCAEEIQNEALKCRFCGEWLRKDKEETKKTEKSFESEDMISTERVNNNKYVETESELKNRYKQMPIDEFSAFEKSYKEVEYTPKAQRIINEVINERRLELENYKKFLEEEFLKNIPKFVSGDSIAKAVMVFLIIAIITGILNIVSDYLQIDLINKIEGSGSYSEAEIEFNDIRQGVAGLLLALVYFITSILFFIWFYRSHRNLKALGNRNLKYGHGWAIGGFFVPILNFIRPYHIMKEIWMKSDPVDNNEVLSGSEWKESSSLALVGWWWILFISFNSLSYISLYLLEQDESISSLVTSTWFSISSNIIYILAAIVTIQIIIEIVKKQKEKKRRISRLYNYED